MNGKTRAIALIATAQVMALSLWFSATAVLPQLRSLGGLDSFHASLFTSLVTAGFVAGTLTSAIFGLADRLNPHRFFRIAALVAGTANLGLLIFQPSSAAVLVCRFITGFCMAGIYPVGMKMVSSWARGDRGMLVGLLVAALTLGSGTPHLYNALGGLDWRLTVLAASVSAYAAALIIGWAELGAPLARSPPFQPAYILHAWTEKPLRLANLGYLGHMWELYAMWGWLAAFLQASFAVSGLEPGWAGAAAFAAIGIGGAIGSLGAGILADRWGRTTIAMTVSGICCLLVGFSFGASPWLVFGLCVVWGVSVIADSAQFSSSVIELSDPAHVGTMLTMQNCMGFILSLITIHLAPYLADRWGWSGAFAVLAIGPFLGAAAMAALRRRPEALKLASGRR